MGGGGALRKAPVRSVGSRIGQKEMPTCSEAATIWSSGAGSPFRLSHTEARGLHSRRAVTLTWAKGNLRRVSAASSR